MNRKYSQTIMALSVLVASQFLYTNCSPSNWNSGFQVLPFPSSSNGSVLADLSGRGALRDIVEGCPLTAHTDFIETEVETARRLEPRDCSIVNIATPVLSWVQPMQFQAGSSFTLRLTSESPASIRFDRTFTSKVPRLFVGTPLEPGTYVWSVTYTKSGAGTETSQPRRFVIASNATFALPTARSVADAILSRSRPRLLAKGMTFNDLANRVRSSEYKPSFENYLGFANTYLTKEIPTVPPNLSVGDFGNDNAKFDAWKLSLRNQILDERTLIEGLGLAFYVTGNAAYRDRAIAHLDSMSRWPTDGATSEVGQDQVNREIYLVLAMGLDLFQDRLNEPAYQSIRSSMIATFKARLAQVNFDSLNRYPYDSHMLTACLYAAEAMMYAAGTPGYASDGGRADLERSWDLAITTFGTWGSATDGGFANSSGYAWYGTGAVTRFMAISKIILGLDMSEWPAASHFGDNQIAMSAPLNNIAPPFGDEAEITDHYSNYSGDVSRLIALITGRADYEWYWRVRPENITNKWLFSPIHFYMLGAAEKSPTPPPSVPQLPKSYLFEDAGLVAIHSQTTDPNRSSLFFRSSRFGSFNHSHADQNAFTFVSHGKNMLISGGVYDYYGSPFHNLVTRATRFKNALTFDGGIGQSEPNFNPTSPGEPVHSMSARGRLLNFGDNGTWAVTTGDATNAYRGRNMNTGAEQLLLSAAYRSVAYNREQNVALIYDRAQSTTPRKWELNFQTLTSNAPNVAGKKFTLTNAGTTLCAEVFTVDGANELTNGWPLVPTKASAPQSQIRFSVRAKSSELTAVTVLREDCRDVPVSVTFNGTEAVVQVNGQTVDFNGKAVQLP